jgi:hypothetical protein
MKMPRMKYFARAGSGRTAREGVDRRLPQGHNIIKVSVAEIPAVHQVKVVEFTKWLGADGRFAPRCHSAAAHSGDFGNAEFSTELTARSCEAAN